MGREDTATVCDIAAPAAKKAQAEGVGPCASAFAMMFTMISPAQKKALQTATIDPKLVETKGPTKVEIPTEAVKATITFSESELGSSTLEYLDGSWYITD
ncbi:hypothetical protein GT354_15380 [Streptomyces sp. SID3343]|nr:hypothetical protein [Streptomyces sp. SID3343]